MSGFRLHPANKQCKDIIETQGGRQLSKMQQEDFPNPVTLKKKKSCYTKQWYLFTPKSDLLITAVTILASQRKAASSGKTEIRAFDIIKSTSNGRQMSLVKIKQAGLTGLIIVQTKRKWRLRGSLSGS